MDEQRAYIKVAAEHSKLKCISDTFTVEKTIREVVCNFEFRTNDWDNLQKTVVFIKNGDTNISPIHIILDTTNSCEVPAEVLSDKGSFSLGVFGSDATHRLPTNLLTFKIHEGCYCSGTAPSAPTQTVYEQIITMLQGLNDYSEEEIKTFVGEYCSDNHIATEEYVNAHIGAGGAINVGLIDHISVNGTDQPISNKRVNLTIPTTLSDLTGDSTHRTVTDAEKSQWNAKVNSVNGVIVSENADYAEILQWYDNNPNNESRLGYFVELDADTPGRTIKIASSNSDVVGVTVDAPAFAGNSRNKFDANGNLLPKYTYVAVHGIVPIIDNGTCTVKGRCMPNTNGTAIPSTNSMGYFVMERIDSTHVLIVVEPNADMLQHIKHDISVLESRQTEQSQGDKNYLHNQRTASAVWSITHNLGKYPSASVVDSGNSVVVGDVSYINENELQITFSAPFSGKCFLN